MSGIAKLLGLVLIFSQVALSSKVLADDTGNSGAAGVWEARQKYEGKQAPAPNKQSGTTKSVAAPTSAPGQKPPSKYDKYNPDTPRTFQTTSSPSSYTPPKATAYPPSTPREFGLVPMEDRCYGVYFDGAVRTENVCYARIPDMSVTDCNTDSRVRGSELRNKEYDYVGGAVCPFKENGKKVNPAKFNSSFVENGIKHNCMPIFTDDSDSFTYCAEIVLNKDNPEQNMVRIAKLEGKYLLNGKYFQADASLDLKDKAIGKMVPVGQLPPNVEIAPAQRISEGKPAPAPAPEPIVVAPPPAPQPAPEPVIPSKEEVIVENKKSTPPKKMDGKYPECKDAAKLLPRSNIKKLNEKFCNKMANEEFSQHCMLEEDCNFKEGQCDVDTCTNQYQLVRRDVSDYYSKYDDALEAYTKALNTERKAAISHQVCVNGTPPAKQCLSGTTKEGKNIYKTTALLKKAKDALKEARETRDEAKKELEKDVEKKLGIITDSFNKGDGPRNCMAANANKDFYTKFRHSLVVYQCHKGVLGAEGQHSKGWEEQRDKLKIPEVTH